MKKKKIPARSLLFNMAQWLHSMERKEREKATRLERENEAKQLNIMVVRSPRPITTTALLEQQKKLLFAAQTFLSKDDVRITAAEYSEQVERFHKCPHVLFICK